MMGCATPEEELDQHDRAKEDAEDNQGSHGHHTKIYRSLMA